MTPEVELAISQIKEAFPGNTIEVIPEAQGGAYVIVNDLFIGNQYAPSETWVGFLIGFQYPQADVYPHFIPSATKRVDGAGLGEGFSGLNDWQGHQVWQISRKSNRLVSGRDTAALKLAKVLKWIQLR